MIAPAKLVISKAQKTKSFKLLPEFAHQAFKTAKANIEALEKEADRTQINGTNMSMDKAQVQKIVADATAHITMVESLIKAAAALKG